MAIHRALKVLIFAVLALGAAGVVPGAWAAGNPGESHGTAYLGVTVDSVPPETASALHLKNGGAYITIVDQDGPACHAGLQNGDVVVAYNGKPVTGSDQFAGLIHDTAAGTTVMMTVIRNGQSKDLKVKLGDWRQMAGMLRAPLSPAGSMTFAEPPAPPLLPRAYPEIDIYGSTPISARNGIVVEALSPQLGEFFGISQNKGVLVRTVEKGSPGAAAGLRAGDVIVKVDNETVHDTADWRRALKAHGDRVTLVIMRDKHEQTLQMMLPRNTSEWKGQDWNGFGIDESTLAWLNSDEIKELQRQAESMAKTMTPEIKKQAEEMSKQTAELRKQAEKAAREMTPVMKKQAEEIRKQAEQMRKDIEKMTPEMAKNAREMAENMKPTAKELADMQRNITEQWKAMQPEFQKQIDQLKKQLEQEQREWQKMFKESNPNQM